MSQVEHVVLVDEHDRALGIEEKMAAHRQAKCHRAFSVFIFQSLDDRTQVLLQQRAQHKYHCPGLWSNTACSHPTLEIETRISAERRLQEEMGFSVPLKHKGFFHYIAHFDNGLSENEIDHVFIGEYTGRVDDFNPDEVANTAWVDIHTLQAELERVPEKYTPWLTQALAIALR